MRTTVFGRPHDDLVTTDSGESCNNHLAFSVRPFTLVQSGIQARVKILVM